MTIMVESRTLVAHSLRSKPIIGVVRTGSTVEAERQARALAGAGIELIEITFTVPGASALVRRLRQELAGRDPAGGGPPWIGMGTVTTAARAAEALAAEAEFLVSPNVDRAVAEAARQAGRFLVMGALTPTEIVAAHELGADLVKVYPLPPVGGPAYLSVVRQPLGDIPMLAAGGFGIDDIPAYRQAGAIAFGIGFPLLAGAPAAAALGERVARALGLATGGAGSAGAAGATGGGATAGVGVAGGGGVSGSGRAGAAGEERP
jgi:2-dehydro-3-deoxyphosphogluconate aldolase/(4S)-4-hydroxy-2-oxoglutarate aldolase